MAIETRCPHCQKSYRLRDELGGKRVTCGNPDCRKPFTVTAATGTNGSTRPASRPAVPRDVPHADAEALAAATFAEDGGAAEDTRTIPLTCAVCDHQWEVPWAMQGKNVLCPNPECRHRQRVPEQKTVKIDWRDPGAGGPSLRKLEKLEGAEGTIDARMVSGETLRKTGVIEEEVEPRPRWQYFAGAALGVAVVAGIVIGIFMILESNKESRQEQYMAEAIQEIADAQDVDLLSGEVPLFRACLQMQAGEYYLRQGKPRDAVDHFSAARQELVAAPSTNERDLLFAELALAQVMLGGTDEQVDGELSRIRWTPPRGGRAAGRGESRVDSVLEELKQTLQAMRDKNAALDVRIWAMRRLTRELAARGQLDLTSPLIQVVFLPTETTQGRAEMAVEALKVSGHMENARKEATQLAGFIQGTTDASLPTVFALAQAVDPPVSMSTTLLPPPPSGEVPEGPRLAFTTLYLLQNKSAEALELARRPGPTSGRLRALALVAEWSSDPGPAVQAASETLDTGKKGVAPTTDLVLLRLACEAGRANQADLVDRFTAVQSREDVRIWTRAVAMRARIARWQEGQTVDVGLAPLPDNAREHRVGHALARMVIARHNARYAEDSQAVLAEINTWTAGTYRPLGKAGLALGLQDRDVR